MPRSFLVKTKTEKYYRPHGFSSSAIVSGPGNGYVREFSRISAGKSEKKCQKQGLLLSNDKKWEIYPAATVSERIPPLLHQPQARITSTQAKTSAAAGRAVTAGQDSRVLNRQEIKLPTRAASPCMSTVPEIMANGVQPTKLQCSNCNRSFETFTTLIRHQQFYCTPAAAATATASQPKRPFHCKYCDKLYVSLGALKMHIRTHTLPCKCHICGKAFSRPWLLQGHIRTHTGDRPYKCTHCQRAFADRSNLRAHLQTHSDVKKYCCTRCTKSFSRMSLLLKHEDSCPTNCNAPTTS